MAAPRRASAQDVQITGPLAGAPAVHHMRIYRESRIMLVPFLGFTLQDDFQRNLFVGARAAYHFTDWLGVEVSGAYAVAQFTTDLTDGVINQGFSSPTTPNYLSLPDPSNFESQLGAWNWTTSLVATFVPLRGKLSLFQKAFVDTDAYILAGVSFNGIEERANIAAATCDAMGAGNETARVSCYQNSQDARSSRVAIAPTFGAGLNLYFNDFLGLNIEWRGMPFKWNNSGTDEAGAGGLNRDGVIDSSDRLRHFNHMFTLGLIIFLPTAAGVGD
jgi:outer membrane beta-barrel protein